MVNLSGILQKLFELHGMIPRLLPGNGPAAIQPIRTTEASAA